MKEETVDLYAQRGVSSGKEGVEVAIAHLGKGLFPGAFCKISQARDPKYGKILHSDGAGTKSILAYLIWKETGDVSVWKGISADSLIMNIDDAICVGATGPFFVSMQLDRNSFLIKDEHGVIAAIIEGCKETCERLTALGIPCIYESGDTADVADTVRTITVNNTVETELLLSDVIDASNIRPSGFIVGFSSTGQATYETTPNSGPGSNGFTNFRHDFLSQYYKNRYPEICAPEQEVALAYRGNHFLTDPLPGDDRFTIGSALLSTTRTYAPIVKAILEQVGRKDIMGFVHCSGGGQTKIGKFGQPGIVYVKENLFPTPPLFEHVQKVSSQPWAGMYRTYNMGHRLEAVVATEEAALVSMEIAKGFNVEAKIIGRVFQHPDPTKRCVHIMSPYGDFAYEFLTK